LSVVEKTGVPSSKISASLAEKCQPTPPHPHKTTKAIIPNGNYYPFQMVSCKW